MTRWSSTSCRDPRQGPPARMTQMAQLSERGVIAVEGADRVGFLQGLVSNDVAEVRARPRGLGRAVEPAGEMARGLLYPRRRRAPAARLRASACRDARPPARRATGCGRRSPLAMPRRSTPSMSPGTALRARSPGPSIAPDPQAARGRMADCRARAACHGEGGRSGMGPPPAGARAAGRIARPGRGQDRAAGSRVR